METRTKSRPTITDVARACGVSEATVSYVINGKRVLKPATREKVFHVMRELNYHPSAVARGLSSKRVHTIGVLLGVVDSLEFMTNSYTSGLLTGILSVAQREGFNVTLFTAQWKDAQTSAPQLRDGRSDGILAIAPPLDSDIMSGLSGMHMPLVAVSAQPHPQVINVDVDNYEGLRLSVEHLVQLGHRRIAFLMGNENLASFAPRRAAFCESLAAHGLAARENEVLPSHFSGAMAGEQARMLLGQPDAPTAICAGNDAIALAVLEEAHKMGIRIPEDLSVVGFDDIPQAGLGSPPLTTVRQPLAGIGEKATQLLVQLVSDPHSIAASNTLLPPELIVRGTTGPARTSTP